MFCDMCQHDSSFGVVPMTRTINIRGVDISVMYRGEVCVRCGAERYDEDIEAFIMQKAMDAYRDKKKIVPAETIRAYMDSNGLSAEEMAKRAGCAVAEILRAEKGALLDLAANDRLKKAISA